MKERIQKKLDISDKDFEKYKFAIIVMGRLEYIPEETQDVRVDLKKFLPHAVQTGEFLRLNKGDKMMFHTCMKRK